MFADGVHFARALSADGCWPADDPPRFQVSFAEIMPKTTSWLPFNDHQLCRVRQLWDIRFPPLSKRHLRPWHNSRLTAMGIMKFRSRINNFSQPIATLSPSNSSALLSIKITLNTKFKARDASTTFLFLHHRSVNDTPTPPPAAPTSGLQRSDGSRLASFFFAWQSGNVVRKFCLKVAPRLGTPRLEEDRVLELPKVLRRFFLIFFRF